MMRKRSDKIGWIKADWSAPDWIHAGTTTRLGGISTSPYDEFNLAQHVGDDQRNVSYNRKLLRQQLELPAHPDWLKQEHGNHVINVQAAHGTESADGSYTNQANVVCAVLTADCLPLLLCDEQGTQIASIHVGWRGLYKNIITKALELFSVERHQLIAWLGPCISNDHYEVGQDVFEAFTNAFADTANAFTPNRDGHWLANLRQLVQQQLEKNGIQLIYGCDSCTFTEADLFYSYRRDGTTGRMASLIWMDSLRT